MTTVIDNSCRAPLKNLLSLCPDTADEKTTGQKKNRLPLNLQNHKIPELIPLQQLFPHR